MAMPLNPAGQDHLSVDEMDMIARLPRASRRYGSTGVVDATRRELAAMAASPDFNTNPLKAGDGDEKFIEKHLIYLGNHTNINPSHYLSNLRLMTKVRH
jgi:hypothetical protein